jgi:hypothetical protein
MTGTIDWIEMQSVGGTATHVLALAYGNFQDGVKIMHSIRDQNGNWSPWGDASHEMQTSQWLQSVGAADVLSAAGEHELHLCGVGADGKLYHGIRYADGSWQTLNDATAVLQMPSSEKIVAADCAGFGSTLKVAIVTYSHIYYASRDSDSSWTPVQPVSSNILGGYWVGAISVANVANDLHVVAVARSSNVGSSYRGTVFHNIRRSDGTWQPQGWAIPPGGAGAYFDVSVAQVNGELHVLAADLSSTWHTIRHANSWDGFNDVQVPAGRLTGRVAQVTVTGSPNLGSL